MYAIDPFYLFDLLHPCRAFNKVPVTSSSAISAVSKLITVDFHLESTA